MKGAYQYPKSHGRQWKSLAFPRGGCLSWLLHRLQSRLNSNNSSSMNTLKLWIEIYNISSEYWKHINTAMPIGAEKLENLVLNHLWRHQRWICLSEVQLGACFTMILLRGFFSKGDSFSKVTLFSKTCNMEFDFQQEPLRHIRTFLRAQIGYRQYISLEW